MQRDSEKHKRIVRGRIIATSVAVLIVLFLTAGLIWGFLTLADKVGKKFFPENEETVTEEVPSEEPVDEIQAEVIEKIEELSSEPAVSSEELQEQYEEATVKEETGVNALEIEEIVAGMSLQDKVAQVFIVRPEQITGVDTVTQAGDATAAALEKYHVGGMIYFDKNLLNPDQTRALLSKTKEFSSAGNGIPFFLAVDEEGGDVTRIAENAEFGIENTGKMSEIGASGDAEKAYEAGKHIGEYLSDYGFNVDFAPVVDVTDSGSSVVGERSFGADPEVVSDMALEYSKGLNENGIIACYKHFPGFGRAQENTDLETVIIDGVTADDLHERDLIPYDKGLRTGDKMVMIGNMSFPEITGDNNPIGMSESVIKDYLRAELGYNGVIVTDALDAAAVRNNFGSGEAAVRVLKAGADMVLCPADFEEAYNGVLSAVESGELSEDVLDSAVSRILSLKSRTMGLK